jgi:hypothetical protein
VDLHRQSDHGVHFWKRRSSSTLLNYLALHLRQMEMSGTIKMNMVHIPNTRMISQGTNGLSRRDLTEGGMSSQNILSFVPLNTSALERQPKVVEWVRDWVPSNKLVFLDLEDWFEKGHGIKGGQKDQFGVWVSHEFQEGWFIWALPPAVADDALEELESSRHKQNHLNHVFISPCLITYTWRKRLTKVLLWDSLYIFHLSDLGKLNKQEAF